MKQSASSRTGQNQPTSFLFLASHGVLSPLSAIRWGCNWLGNATEGLSEEQRSIVAHIGHNAALLSRVMQSLLLLARLEEHVHAFVPKALPFAPVVRREAEEWKRLQKGVVDVDCSEDLLVYADETPLLHAIQNIFSVFLEEKALDKSLSVRCAREGDMVKLRLSGRMQAPFIQYVQTIQLDDNIRSVVGGTPGLFLATTQGIIDHLDGTLEMYEEKEGTYAVEASLPLGTAV